MDRSRRRARRTAASVAGAALVVSLLASIAAAPASAADPDFPSGQEAFHTYADMAAEVQATAQGVYSGMTFSLGSVVGAVLGGAAAPFLGLPGMFAVAAVAGVVGALVVGRAASTAAAARKVQPAFAAEVPA